MEINKQDSHSEAINGQIIPPEEAEAIRKLVRVEVSQITSYSGPLPQASEFEKYENTLAGAADRILSMAEKEQDERHRNQKKIIELEAKIRLRGQAFAFTISLAFCLLSLYLISKGHYYFGVSVLFSIAGLAYVFISGKYVRPEVDTKTNQQTPENNIEN